VIAWLRRNPIAAVLPFQALLYFYNLGAISPWGDEAYALQTMHLPVAQVLDSLAHDYHPPLYYLLLYVWQRLPMGLTWETQGRALSGILAMAAIFAADRLWASRLVERSRLTFLTIWSVAPCLVMYARMCHSFTLQLLVGTVVAALILRFVEKQTLEIWLVAGLIVALYTHYVPGLALLATANLALVRARRWKPTLILNAVVAAAYLPWVWWLVRALGGWTNHPPLYSLTGAAIPELVVKLAYWAMTFVIGEAQPDVVLAAGGVLVLLVLTLVLSGARRDRRIVWLLAPMALIGFAGVSRWLAYPFIAPRMLFLYPLVLILFVEGATAHRRIGVAAVAATLLASITGLWSYSHGTGFRNKQYLVPFREIATEIERQSSVADTVVLVDTPNSDIVAMEYWLGASSRVVGTQDPSAAAAITDPLVHTVWFLRNTHDATREKLDDRFESELRAGMRTAEIRQYEPFSPLERWVMRRAGMNPPEYFQVLCKFQR
jgi:hypothetical protein